MGRMTAAWAISRLESMFGPFRLLMAHRGRGELGDEVVGVEALELERLDQLRRLAVAISSASVTPVIGAALNP